MRELQRYMRNGRCCFICIEYVNETTRSELGHRCRLYSMATGAFCMIEQNLSSMPVRRWSERSPDGVGTVRSVHSKDGDEPVIAGEISY